MTLGRGRVLGRGSEPPSRLRWTAGEQRGGRVLRREVVAAEERARAIVLLAEQRAAALVEAAERAAASIRLGAEAEGRADAVAAVAAHALMLAALEARSTERQLDRVVDLAKVLAERLVGEALELRPELVILRARELVAAGRGARQAVVFAHPEDAAILGRVLSSLGMAAEAVKVIADPERGRGSLRIETDIGVLDGELAPQLERLALKLRESIGP